MQENSSDNNLSPSQTKKPLEDYYLNNNGYNDSPHGDDNARKKKIVAGVVVVAVVIAIVIIIAVSLGNSMGGIEIVGEQLVTDPYFLRSQLLRRRQPARKRSGKLYYACPRRRSLSARSKRQRLPHVVLSRILLQDHQVACLLIIISKQSRRCHIRTAAILIQITHFTRQNRLLKREIGVEDGFYRQGVRLATGVVHLV